MNSLSRWLDVEVGTSEIKLDSLPSNIVLADIHNDNEFKLVVGDLGTPDQSSKIKIFKGAMQISDMDLSDLPLGVVSFYASETSPRTAPLIAVAFSSSVYIYRNLKLFYKYYLPIIEQNQTEMEIWKQLTDMSNNNKESIISLSKALSSIPSHALSSQSQTFLLMTVDQKLDYLDNKSEVPQQLQTEISCITTLKLSSNDKNAVSCLVIGCENGDVIYLDPHTFTQMAMAKLSSVKMVPFQMIASGLYNIDYRITIATRDKSVCILKHGLYEGRLLFSTMEHIVSIEVMMFDNSIMVICCDNTLACYNRKGKKQWWLSLEHRPVAMCLVPVLHLGVTLTAVSLSSGHVYLFDGKVKRDTIFVRDVASVIKFGRLGQEEHAFVIMTASGNLMLKLLKRTAEFNGQAAGIEPATSNIGQKPWMIPKKSKLFLEQSMRERENATEMHESFEHDLNKLRLKVATTLIEAHTRSDNTMALGDLGAIKLAVEVDGLGPTFLLTLIISNTSSSKSSVGLSVLFHLTTSYKVDTPYIKVPLLSPGCKLKFRTKIEEIFSENMNPEILFRSVTGQSGEGSVIKILLLKAGKCRPVLAANVQIPPTDPILVPYDKMQPTGFKADDFLVR